MFPSKFFLILVILICTAFTFPRLFINFKYENVPDWADYNSASFDPSRLDLGYYFTMEEKGKAINKAFPIGMPKEEAERILKTAGFEGPFIKKDSPVFYNWHRYNKELIYFEFLYVFPVPQYLNYNSTFSLIYEDEKIVSRHIGTNTITNTGALEYVQY